MLLTADEALEGKLVESCSSQSAECEERLKSSDEESRAIHETIQLLIDEMVILLRAEQGIE